MTARHYVEISLRLDTIDNPSSLAIVLGVELVGVVCLPASLFLRLALCVSMIGLALVGGVGVISARLMASKCEMDKTAWRGAAR